MKSTVFAGRLALALGAGIVLLGLIGGASAEEDGADDSLLPLDRPELSWTVLPHDVVRVKKAPPSTEEAVERIRELLRALTRIDSPQLGLTASSSGGGPGFAPIGDRVWRQGFGVKNLERFEDSKAIAELVALGPQSIPLLLEELGDSTLTKLTFEHPGGLGEMWQVAELPVHLGSEREVTALSMAFPSGGVQCAWQHGIYGLMLEVRPQAHRVTVGDACFSTLGQIVNRPYEAVRCQPTGSIIVSSPTLEPRLRTALRAMWGGDNPRVRLLQSLVQDFHTRGEGSEGLQQGAGIRLLTYFPAEGEALVRARLDGLVLDETDWQKRWIANGHVNAGEFLAQLFRTRHPTVAEAWLRFLQLSTSPDVLRNALDVPKEVISKEAKERLGRLLRTAEDPDLYLSLLALAPEHADDETLARLVTHLESPHVKCLANRVKERSLRAVFDLYPKEAERVYRGHVARHGMLGRIDVLLALDSAFIEFPAFGIKLLTEFLASQDPIPGWRIHLSRGGASIRRVRDLAAVILAKRIEALDFDPWADEKGRDRQIEVLRGVLD